MIHTLTSQRFDAAQKEIAFSFERVPFLRKHMEAAGLKPEDLSSPEALERFPPTEKSDYRRNFPVGVLAQGQNLNQPGVLQMKSSGTESDRLTTAARSIFLARRLMTCLQVNPRFSFLTTTRQIKSVRFAAPNCSDVECANPNSTFEDRLLPDRTLVLPVYHDLLTTPGKVLDTAVSDLARHGPHFVYADSAHLSLLARHVQFKQLEGFAPRGVALGFSVCTQVGRAAISRWLGPEVPLAEVVAMSEFGWLAMECPRGKLHLNTDAFYFELVAPDPACERASLFELLVTSLGDDLSPHIRYRTGDLYRPLGPCDCGHRFPAVRAEGRLKNLLEPQPGDLLTPREVDELVGPAAGMDLYQLEEESDAAFCFRFIPSANVTAPSDDVEARLRTRLGPARLRVERTQYIPAERSGKFMTCKRADGRVAAARTRANG